MDATPVRMARRGIGRIQRGPQKRANSACKLIHKLGPLINIIVGRVGIKEDPAGFGPTTHAGRRDNKSGLVPQSEWALPFYRLVGILLL